MSWLTTYSTWYVQTAWHGLMTSTQLAWPPYFIKRQKRVLLQHVWDWSLHKFVVSILTIAYNISTLLVIIVSTTTTTITSSMINTLETTSITSLTRGLPNTSLLNLENLYLKYQPYSSHFPIFIIKHYINILISLFRSNIH